MTHYNLRNLRVKYEMSQQSLAHLLGVDRTTYAGYEKGNLDIPFGLILKLCALWGVQPGEFVASDQLIFHDDTLSEEEVFSPDSGVELSPEDAFLLSERERVLLAKIRLLEIADKTGELENYIDSLLEKD